MRARTSDNTVPLLGAWFAFIPDEQVVCATPGDFGFFGFKDKLIHQLGFHSAIPNINFIQRLVISHLLGRTNPKGASPARTWPRQAGIRRWRD